MTQPPYADPGRRRFTSGVAAATLAAPFFWVRQATAAEQVIVRTPGGVFDDIKRETIYEPFRKETGIEVVPVAATAAKLMAMMKSGQNELDVIDTGDSTLLELEKSNYLVPLAYEEFKYTNLADIDPVVKRKYQLGSFIYAMVLGYNTKAMAPGSEPKSWAEFWDVKRFPARRTLPDMASGTPSLEFALIADGVPMNKLYPLDIDRAFKSMSRIRALVPKFWDTGALSSTMIADNEVSMGALWSTRAAAAQDQGAPHRHPVEPERPARAGLRHPGRRTQPRQCQEVHRLQLLGRVAGALARQVQGNPRQHQGLRRNVEGPDRPRDEDTLDAFQGFPARHRVVGAEPREGRPGLVEVDHQLTRANPRESGEGPADSVAR